MATIHSLRIDMDWGKYLDYNNPDNPRNDVYYLILTSNNWQKPFMHFTDTPFSGTIVSATLSINLYAAPTASWINVYRVNRAANTNATWNSTGLGAWDVAGCNGPADHSTTAMIVNTAKLSAGWNHLTINNLSELRLLIDDLDMLVFHYMSETYLSDHYIVKEHTPYLTINYTTSLLGGVQIF